MDDVHHCPWCKSPQPIRDCLYCPSYRLRIKMEQDKSQRLRQELERIQSLEWDLDMKTKECQRLHKKYVDVVHYFYDLKELYVTQDKVIQQLKKEKIEHLGKFLLSFLFKQSDDS